MAFNKDLKNGEAIEREILTILLKKYPLSYKEDADAFRDYYDLVIPEKKAKIEIKADFYVSDNMAFECLGRGGHESGILRTTAEYWIQFRKDKYYVWNTEKLKKYLTSLKGKHLRHVGDDKATIAWIIPEIKVLEECPPTATIDRHSDLLFDVF